MTHFLRLLSGITLSLTITFMPTSTLLAQGVDFHDKLILRYNRLDEAVQFRMDSPSALNGVSNFKMATDQGNFEISSFENFIIRKKRDNGGGGFSETPRFWINEDGLVSIGRQSPSGPELLQVRNDLGNSNIKVLAKGGDKSTIKLLEDGGFGYEFEYDGTEDHLNLWSRNFSGNEGIRMTWEKSGKVGLNQTSPNGMLHIKQLTSEKALRLENDTNTNDWSWEIGTADLNIYFNGTRVGWWDDGTGSYNATSDVRGKKDIQYLQGEVLNQIIKLRPAYYRLKHASFDIPQMLGFIAQDVRKHFPELIKYNDDGSLGLHYSDFGVLSIKAIQEQQNDIEGLKEELAVEVQRNKEHSKLIGQLMERVRQLEKLGEESR